MKAEREEEEEQRGAIEIFFETQTHAPFALRTCTPATAKDFSIPPPPPSCSGHLFSLSPRVHWSLFLVVVHNVSGSPCYHLMSKPCRVSAEQRALFVACTASDEDAVDGSCMLLNDNNQETDD